MRIWDAVKTELHHTWTQLGLAEDEGAQTQCCADLRAFVQNNWLECSKTALGYVLPRPTSLEEAPQSPSPDIQDPDEVDDDPEEAPSCEDVHDVLDPDLRDFKKVMIFTEGESTPKPQHHSKVGKVGSSLIINVKAMKDPDSFPWRGHLGLHPEMHGRVQEFLMRKDCDVLRKVKKFIASQPDPHVTFQCSKGKHRSVATAFLVAKCVKSAGYDVEVVHRSRGTWSDWQWECYDGWCKECSWREDLWLHPDNALWKYWEAL